MSIIHKQQEIIFLLSTVLCFLCRKYVRNLFPILFEINEYVFHFRGVNIFTNPKKSVLKTVFM